MAQFFKFKENNTDLRTESVAGMTTFLAMAYILFVNPDILAAAGMDQNAVFVATALSAAIATLVMGLLANYPIALAPGMGLNAFFAFSVVIGMGIEWQVALFGVFCSGIIFTILSVSNIRETIINAIPAEMKYAAGAGIGLFIAFIGLQNTEIIVADDATIVALGDLSNPSVLLTIFGLVVTVIFLVIGLKGGIFFGMVVTAVVGMIFGVINTPDSIVAPIPSLEPTFGQLFTIDFSSVFTLQLLIVILTFLFVDFFDTAGTLYGVANQAGFIKDNKLPRAGRALLADSTAGPIGAILGTSTTTSYVESAAGVGAGGRTGFTSVVTALFFIVALFFSPLLAVVTPAVTGPALILVGVMMASALKQIDWNRLEIAIPAFFTILAMPLTYSIATGIAMGFVFYPVTMICKGKAKEVHPLMYGLFVVFLLYFIFLK
ncbi:guanine permease [Alkalihalobacillus alcalophilus ATCC 27647 = CGMCC 1.3604]|uniref:Guanine permease n=1 Tax=Alkalihalobacillus alcalophilus ATCC 27647 = CGMCC 1.3604 TaxID=1218173 RepID=A0A094XA44_ALKAL|nr:NCS2 family permease [Alkalihalobacillus alcalophilus]KGA95650.1 guanine permease [Alkalihalobacillus alcalophilus ATCC 27647 = CGMCC 1.3604]MED1562830.1 NCS2 family permease [Alkalihalobacillus alcalophilus]THG89335.1 guanine permease [Alkalihalobacillus alcalophilus ATCC 27647 = CGMCC 1.3604]